MNDRLKFRIWDGEKMHYPIDIQILAYAVFWKNEGDWARYSIGGTVRSGVQQYIGLKDRNGKEMYSGDIVRKYFLTDTGWNHNNLPVFEVKWNQQHCGYGITVGSRHCYEVVGNMFENPELLK